MNWIQISTVTLLNNWSHGKFVENTFLTGLDSWKTHSLFIIILHELKLKNIADSFQGSIKRILCFKANYKKTFSENLLVRFVQILPVWTTLPRWTFIQLRQGELRYVTTFFALFFFQSCDPFFFFSFRYVQNEIEQTAK